MSILEHQGSSTSFHTDTINKDGINEIGRKLEILRPKARVFPSLLSLHISDVTALGERTPGSAYVTSRLFGAYQDKSRTLSRSQSGSFTPIYSSDFYTNCTASPTNSSSDFGSLASTPSFEIDVESISCGSVMETHSLDYSEFEEELPFSLECSTEINNLLPETLPTPELIIKQIRQNSDDLINIIKTYDRSTKIEQKDKSSPVLSLPNLVDQLNNKVNLCPPSLLHTPKLSAPEINLPLPTPVKKLHSKENLIPPPIISSQKTVLPKPVLKLQKNLHVTPKLPSPQVVSELYKPQEKTATKKKSKQIYFHKIEIIYALVKKNKVSVKEPEPTHVQKMEPIIIAKSLPHSLKNKYHNDEPMEAYVPFQYTLQSPVTYTYNNNPPTILDASSFCGPPHSNYGGESSIGCFA